MITIVMLTGEKYPINIESPGGISDMRIRAQQRFISLQTVSLCPGSPFPLESFPKSILLPKSLPMSPKSRP